MVNLTTKQYRDYLSLEGYPEDDITNKVIAESEKEETLRKILENKAKYKRVKEKKVLNYLKDQYQR